LDSSSYDSYSFKCLFFGFNWGDAMYMMQIQLRIYAYTGLYGMMCGWQQ
jgi:hypothetical protein